ncbi:MAG: cytochrome c biogenesis protein CcsA, partial [Pseudomonadota bacterium]
GESSLIPSLFLILSTFIYLCMWYGLKNGNLFSLYHFRLGVCAAIIPQWIALSYEIHSGVLFNLSLMPSILFAATATTTLMFLGTWRYPLQPLGLVVFPLDVLSNLIQFFDPNSNVEYLTEPRIASHVLLSMTAIGILLVVCAQAWLLRRQDRALKTRHLHSTVENWPSLQTMEKILFESLLIGTLILTLAVVSGFWFLSDMLEQHVAHKVVFTLITWIVLMVLIWGRRRYGWRGPRVINAILIGVGFLVVGFFGSKVVLELILHR